MAHLEDNLMTVASGLEHDGEGVTVDAEMSPTIERLAVYMWLTLINIRLPAYIYHRFMIMVYRLRHEKIYNLRYVTKWICC